MAKLLRCIFGKASRTYDVPSANEWSFSPSDLRAAYYDLLAHYRRLEADYDVLSRANYKLYRENSELRGENSEMRKELDSTQYPLAYQDLERDYSDLHEDYEELEEEVERMAGKFYRHEANLSLRYRASVEDCERLRRDFAGLRKDFEGLQGELDESARENATLQKEVDQWRTGFEQLYAYSSRCEARIAFLENETMQHVVDTAAGKTIPHRKLSDLPLQHGVRSQQDDSNRFSDATSTTIDDVD